jgi:protein-tyrosine phosphatase
MIDLHCNVLDETACGPESFNKSLEVCRMAVACGVRMIVATPGWDAGDVPSLQIEKYKQKADRLQKEMQGALIVKLGFTLQFSPALPDIVDRYGSQLALSGKRHLLISLPPMNLAAEIEEVWSHLDGRGFLPIIVHPECHPVLRRDPARLAAWVSKGAVLQIDAASLTGTYGRLVQRAAIECLVKYKKSSVVASNARRGRSNMLGEARNELMRRMGVKAALMYFRQTPNSIVCGAAADEHIAPRSPVSRLTALLRSRKSLGFQKEVS